VKFARRQDTTSGTPLAPLLDVVFLLLIFFVVTTSFAESHVPLDLPEASSGKPGEESALRIEIDAEGGIVVEGESLGLEDLGLRLGEAHAEQRPIEIRADRTSEHGRFVTVLDLARQVGIEAIGIAVDADAPVEIATPAPAPAG
jgi:biopolymer transport protein ExbD